MADGASVARHSHTLEIVVTDLYVDATTASPKVVLNARATLIDADGAVDREHTHELSSPARSREAADVVAAWNDTLTDLVEAVFEDLGTPSDR